MIQQKESERIVALTIPPTTTKTWSQVLNYTATTNLPTSITSETTQKSNKRKLDTLTTTTTSITNYFKKKTKPNNDEMPP